MCIRDRIYIELHYIFASVWGHQIYTLFGILILAFLLLLVVCSFITVRGEGATAAAADFDEAEP